MSGITHVIVGAMLGELTKQDVLLVMAGSLLPDVDCRTSLLGRFIPAWLFAKHRGVFHTLDAAAIVLLLSLPIGLGYLSHLAMDRSFKLTKFTRNILKRYVY